MELHLFQSSDNALLMCRIIRKLREYSGQVSLIAPVWPAQPWYPPPQGVVPTSGGAPINRLRLSSWQPKDLANSSIVDVQNAKRLTMHGSAVTVNSLYPIIEKPEWFFQGLLVYYASS